MWREVRCVASPLYTIYLLILLFSVYVHTCTYIQHFLWNILHEKLLISSHSVSFVVLFLLYNLMPSVDVLVFPISFLLPSILPSPSPSPLSFSPLLLPLLLPLSSHPHTLLPSPLTHPSVCSCSCYRNQESHMKRLPRAFWNW